MDIEIQNKRDNKLLDRTEVRFRVRHDGEPTPTRDAVRDALAGSLNAKKERVILQRLQSDFGRGSSKGYAKVYPSTDQARSVERHFTLVRNGLADAVETAPKPKPAKPKPAEAEAETGGEAEDAGAEEAEADDEDEAGDGEAGDEAGSGDEGGDDAGDAESGED